MEHSDPPRQMFWLTAWFEMTVLIPHSKSMGCKPEWCEFGGQAPHVNTSCKNTALTLSAGRVTNALAAR